MNLPNTNASISNGSRNSALERPLNQFLLLGALGLSLAGIHEAWDLSLGLPGHFGLVWMASLICARAGSNLRFAALTTAIAYAGGASAFSGGTHSLFGHAPGYLVAALALDLAWRLLPSFAQRRLTAALLGGIAFALKPLVTAVLVALIGIKAGSLSHGIGFPVLTHFCFGATGAVIGALAWQGIQSSRAHA